MMDVFKASNNALKRPESNVVWVYKKYEQG